MKKKCFVFLLGLLFIVTTPIFGGTYPMPHAPYYSQEGQDKYVIEKIFKHKKNGIFFDIGAHDGISYSNTYYLEKNLAWSGICIEPQEENFEALQKNRNCLCLKGCVFNSSGIKDFLKVNGPSEMLSGLLESYDSRHLERAKKEVTERGGSLEIIKIETFAFNDICQKQGITHIDFLSIDTEGSEELIIKSIDFESIDISVIVVENNFHQNVLKEFLASKGYQRVRIFGGDEIYIKGLS